MPYESISGRPERASRTGHTEAAIRALADTRTFHVPAEALTGRPEIEARLWPRDRIGSSSDAERLVAAIAVDGSRLVERVRDGLPSVVYGFAQCAAVYVDLAVLESQQAERFVDPVVIAQAVNESLVSVDLPCAGAYSDPGVDIQTSWRRLLADIFRTKRVEVNGLDMSLLDLLLLLHGSPGMPAKTLPVNCPACGTKDVAVPGDSPRDGTPCVECSSPLHPTDVLRIHEEVVEDGTNESALGRLMSVIELLVLVGLASLLWSQDRARLSTILFVADGPLAMYGPPAPLRSKALAFFQAMAASTPGHGPYLVGIEKSGTMVDYARALAQHDILRPGHLLICDDHVISQVTNTDNPIGYGKDTYWGRKFVYRTLQGHVVVPTVVPPEGLPYDASGGQPTPDAYPTLPAILDVLDRAGSSAYRDGIIPVALAHGKAAFPIGVGSDVLRLVAKTRLGVADSPMVR